MFWYNPLPPTPGRYHYKRDRLDGVVVERPPRVWEVASSIPGSVKSKTLKMVVTAALLGAQGFEVSITTDRLVSE